MRRFIRYLVIVALWTSVLILATFGSMMVILASSFLPNQIIVLISAGVFFVAYTWFCYNFTMRISFKKTVTSNDSFSYSMGELCWLFRISP